MGPQTENVITTMNKEGKGGLMPPPTTSFEELMAFLEVFLIPDSIKKLTSKDPPKNYPKHNVVY